MHDMNAFKTLESVLDQSIRATGGGIEIFGVLIIVSGIASRIPMFTKIRINRGCTPKKVLVAAGHALHRGRAAARLGRPDRSRKADESVIFPARSVG
jgi:hypothetical protein